MLPQASCGTLYRRYFKQAGIVGLTFHDTRHEAVTRLSKIFTNPLELARITGHKDIRQLMSYYNETPENLAKRFK